MVISLFSRTTPFVLQLLALSAVVLSQDCSVPPESRRDCGHVGTTQSECLAKGCCWKPSALLSDGIPWCFYPVGSSCFLDDPSGTTPFTDDEIRTLTGFFMENIDIDNVGAVCASPSRSDPDYYYHWERDGALTMSSLMYISDGLSDYQAKMEDYVKWVLKVQHESCPPCEEVRINPKYDIPDGKCYVGGWCRPQTDGPGLRALSLTAFANALLSSGQKNYVTEYLWTNSETYSGGAIKFDLEWVATQWQLTGCDLWEEVHSTDFFWNRMIFKRALLEGASLARNLGDESTAARYLSVAGSINSTLPRHWNGQFVFEEDNRQKDTAVILAFNWGFYEPDGMFAPTSKEVAGTISMFNDLFCSIFDINMNDTASNIPGVLYGRYPGDVYYGGNPWILNSAALARLYYRGASYLLRNSHDWTRISKSDRAAWMSLCGMLPSELHDVRDLVRAMTSKGDAVLKRIRYHVQGAKFHLSEQLDRNSGYEKSAKDLTWSYAEVLGAMKCRKDLSVQLKRSSS